MKNNDAIDLTKIIMAIMVVSIHVNPWGNTRALVLARIAVPVFFIIGAYFFFHKIKESSDRALIVKLYIFRLIKLYISWFIVLFPITLMIRGYFIHGFSRGLKSIFLNFIFGSTFVASWYIMATIIGTLLVYILTKYIGNIMTLLIGFIIYLVCCMATNYSGICTIQFLKYYPGNIYNSFPVAVVWIVIGKLFAEYEFNIKRSLNILFFLISLILLEVEGVVVREISYTDDCYIMLIPVSVLLFALLNNCTIKIPLVRQLRSFGTITFCSHASLKRIISFLLKRVLDITVYPGACILFTLTIVGCIVLTFMIMKIENKKHFRWVRMLY